MCADEAKEYGLIDEVLIQKTDASQEVAADDRMIERRSRSIALRVRRAQGARVHGRASARRDDQTGT